MYFTAYLAAGRRLDHAALELRAFDPGAVVRRGREASALSDPLRDPGALVPSLLSGAATVGDKRRILRLAMGDAPEGTESAGGFVNNAVDVSAVAPSYAPRGQRLLSVVSLQGFELSDEEVFRRGVADVTSWFPEADLAPLAVYRIPYAQFAQPPGVHDRLPGLFLAGEYTEDSSINGSMLSGEKAALEVLRP